MKAKFEIDATPEEWRRFFGMPDVSDLHNELLNQAREKMASGEYDPLTILKQFMPENLQKMTDLQQNYWENLFSQKKS